MKFYVREWDDDKMKVVTRSVYRTASPHAATEFLSEYLNSHPGILLHGEDEDRDLFRANSVLKDVYAASYIALNARLETVELRVKSLLNSLSGEKLELSSAYGSVDTVDEEDE